MDWEIIADRKIREAMEEGLFDDLPGRGKPLDLGGNPYEEPLAGTLRRIFRDNGVRHPLAEGRQALEAELQDARRELNWLGKEHDFRERIGALNREIRLFNLKAPLPNFHISVIDVESELVTFRASRESR